jgi:pheromone shutdown protein TraB
MIPRYRSSLLLVSAVFLLLCATNQSEASAAVSNHGAASNHGSEASNHASADSTTRRRRRRPFLSLFWGRHAAAHVENGNTAATTATTTFLSPAGQTRNTTAPLPLWKRALPERLQRRSTLQLIRIPTSQNTQVQVYLLGTSHVSNDSSADVTLLLEHLKPDVVFLELCEQRVNLLTPAEENNDECVDSSNSTDSSLWKRVQQIQQHSNMTKLSAFSTVLLTRVQHRYADSLGVELGSEFRVAYEYCISKPHGRRPLLILGDRPLQLTLLRAWEHLSWWETCKVIVSLLWSSLQKPNPDELRQWMQSILESHDTTDLLTESIHELRKHVPSLERSIITERDCYMACKLHQMSMMLPRHLNITCVAIVGAGHCEGIQQWLTNSSRSNGKSPPQLLHDLVQTKKFSQHDVASLMTHVTELPLVDV